MLVPGSQAIPRSPALSAWLMILAMLAPRHALAVSFFWHPEIAPAGPVVVVVSLDEQAVYAYRNGVAIGASPISSGKPGHETPPGVYSILQKAREHRSNLYDDAPMPYMQRLTWDGIALHGGILPGHPASHGCVRLPQAFAEKLFGITRRGGVVVVAAGRVSPARIVHPAAVAPIDLSGAPMPATAPPGEDLLDTPGPLSVVVSLRDRQAYVLRAGLLVASTPLTLTPPAAPTAPAGTLLYVMGAPPAAGSEAAAGNALPQWSAYRILGDGPVPEPAQMAALVHIPEPIGARLRAVLAPGSTILVTDLPGYGDVAGPPYAKLLESLAAPPPTEPPGGSP